jgi:hypothetical protein
MSKGLDALKNTMYLMACCKCQYYKENKCKNKGECFWKTIEQELKALEIIKNKRVDVAIFFEDGCVRHRERLTKEEYDLLKEILL